MGKTGPAILTGSATGQTDENGAFRTSGIVAGTYQVSRRSDHSVGGQSRHARRSAWSPPVDCRLASPAPRAIVGGTGELRKDIDTVADRQPSRGVNLKVAWASIGISSSAAMRVFTL